MKCPDCGTFNVLTGPSSDRPGQTLIVCNDCKRHNYVLEPATKIFRLAGVREAVLSEKVQEFRHHLQRLDGQLADLLGVRDEEQEDAPPESFVSGFALPSDFDDAAEAMAERICDGPRF